MTYRYPLTRALHRHIYYHAGPTNSGKTHAAIESFKSARSGIYCAPLRMLAHEIFHRCNQEVSHVVFVVASFPDLPARTQTLYAKYFIAPKSISRIMFACEREGLGTRLVCCTVLSTITFARARSGGTL